MTPEEAAKQIEMIRVIGERDASSKQSAIKALIEAGILTKSGKVAAPYRNLLAKS